ncbi:hypothetical protein ES705_18728 [subsurface metagenome]
MCKILKLIPTCLAFFICSLNIFNCCFVSLLPICSAHEKWLNAPSKYKFGSLEIYFKKTSTIFGETPILFKPVLILICTSALRPIFTASSDNCSANSFVQTVNRNLFLSASLIRPLGISHNSNIDKFIFSARSKSASSIFVTPNQSTPASIKQLA